MTKKSNVQVSLSLDDLKELGVIHKEGKRNCKKKTKSARTAARAAALGRRFARGRRGGAPAVEYSQPLPPLAAAPYPSSNMFQNTSNLQTEALRLQLENRPRIAELENRIVQAEGKALDEALMESLKGQGFGVRVERRA